MSSFLNKFKTKQNDTPPQGVNMQFTSFAMEANQNTYIPPTIPQNTQPQQQAQQPLRQKGKPGGGWQDDEPSPKKQTTQANLINESPQKQTTNVLLPPQHTQPIQLSKVCEFKIGQLLTYEELEIGGYEHEFHLVSEVIKLGGIRLKQSDGVLKEFSSAAQNLQEQIVGSILLNKLYSEENWKVQIRGIYAIQYISQQYSNYREFFKINQQYLRLETDQQIMLNLIEQTLQEINGQQVLKKQDFQIDFIEPPKPQVEITQLKKQEQANILDIMELSPPQDQKQIQQQPPQQQQKNNAFTFLKNGSKQQQQPIVVDQQQQQQQQPQKTTQQQQLDLLNAAFSNISLQQPINNNNPPIQQNFQPIYQSQIQQPQIQHINQPYPYQQTVIPQQQQQGQKKNAFGFIKKNNDTNQQTIPENTIQQTQQYNQAFQQYNQTQYTQPSVPNQTDQKKKFDDNAFDFLNL